MLLKLIGYEMKAFGRIMLPLYAALLGFALLTGLSIQFLPQDFLSGLPGILIFMLYGILMMSIIIMTCVLYVTRFYKNLLGLEGYLMFSLPTDTATLITSKVLSVLIWSMLSTVVSFLAVFLSALGAGGVSIFKGIAEIFSHPELLEYLPNAIGTTILFMLMLILGAAASIVRIYAGIAIGHQFNDHRILMSIVALIGFNMIGTTLSTICSRAGVYFGIFDSFGQIFEADTTQALYLAQGGMILFLLVQTAFFGVITWLLLDRKLNLE